MKKIITFCALLLVAGLTHAQLTAENSKFIKSTEHDDLSIEAVYVGGLWQSGFNMDSATLGEYGKDYSLRFGGELEWKANKWLSLSTLGLTEISSIGNKIESEVFAKIHFDGFTGKVGYMGTPSTALRPKTLTGDRQFETATSAQLPEEGLGMSLAQKVGTEYEYCEVSAGAFIKDEGYEYAFTMHGARPEKFEAYGTMYYRTHDEALGIALKLSRYITSDFKLDAMWSYEAPDPEKNLFVDTKTNYIFGAVSFGDNFSNIVYCDFGQKDYYPTHDVEDIVTDVSRLEFGLLKQINFQYSKALTGFSWRDEEHRIMFYCMIYL